MTHITQRSSSLLLTAAALVALTLVFAQVSAQAQPSAVQPAAAPERPTQAQDPVSQPAIGELAFTVDSSTRFTVPVHAFSVGASQSGTTHVGGGGGAGKANFQDLSVTIAAGTYSPDLLSYLATGTILDGAFLDVPLPDGTPATYELENVIVTSIAEGSSSDDLRFENMSLNYGAVTKTIGGASFGWSVTENVVIN